MKAFSIRKGAIILGALTGIGFLAVISAQQAALSRLKIGGPMYRQLSNSNSMVSDILPPPQYILEPYLEATLALQRPAGLAEHKARLAALHRKYDQRLDYWRRQSIDTDLQELLTVASNAEVQQFWRLTEREFLPALSRGDRQAASSAYARMGTAYRRHRAVIDRLVVLATADGRKMEVEAERQENLFTFIAWSVAALVLAVLAAAIAWLVLGVVRPLSRITEAMTEIANQHYGVAIEGLGRSDEIGAMAGAIVKFRDGLIEADRLRHELVEHQVTTQAAEQASRAKSAFLANMSHELRTPLNAIIGFSDIAMQGLFGPLHPKYQEYVRLINRSGMHLLDIITDILDMAKIEAGKFVLNVETLELDDIVQECADMIRHRCDGRLFELRISGQKNISLTADRKALRQMLLNLLSNAAKFCSEKGRVEIYVAAFEGTVSIEVRDDGIGIAQRDLSRLGRAFEQVTQDATLARGGTGLGLALVHALAEKHGGTVRIASQVGEGTAVGLSLPQGKLVNRNAA